VTVGLQNVEEDFGDDQEGRQGDLVVDRKGAQHFHEIGIFSNGYTVGARKIDDTPRDNASSSGHDARHIGAHRRVSERHGHVGCALGRRLGGQAWTFYPCSTGADASRVILNYWFRRETARTRHLYALLIEIRG
jgi:hypothetical protein